jgi:hypothetical protein
MTESTEQTASAKPGCATGGQCLCAGTGPAVTGAVSHMMRQYGPSEPVRRHFSQARLEILKGLRALLDQRIEEIQKPASRGSKVTVD